MGEGMQAWVILGYLVWLSAWDIRRKAVPLGALAAGGVLSTALVAGRLTDRETAVLGELVTALLGLFPGFFLLVVARLSRKAGYADGLVLMTVGFAESYLLGFVLLCISCLLLSLCSIFLLAARRVKKTTQMPYIPFLALGYLICGVWRFGGGFL